MTARVFAIAAGALLVGGLFAINLFGRQLQELFLGRPGIDKVLHVIAYAVMFAAIYWIAGQARREPRTRLLVTAAAGLALSIADEMVQALAPDRSVETFDLFADWAGLTLGWIAVARPARRIAAAAAAVALMTATFVTYATYVRFIDYSRAIEYERRQQFAVARVHYLRALEVGLRNSAVYNGLAWVTVESGIGSPQEAVDYARLALELRPDDPDTLDTYGWALHHAGRSAEALSPLKQAYEMKPDMYCIHYHLGAVYRALGQRQLAEFHFERQRELPGTREAGLAIRALEAMAAHQ